MAKVISRVPRGFTRYYVLHLLKKRPMTGKEIIEEAEKETDGSWTPSPGLIYPLLGRLVRGGLIEEVEDGRFTITSKGESTVEKYTEVYRQLEDQFRLVRKLGGSMLTAGRFLVEEAIDRIVGITSTVNEVVSKSSKDLQTSFNEKYRAFLENELSKLERRHETDRIKKKDQEI